MQKLIVLAIGGNLLIKDPSHMTVADQYRSVVETCPYLIKLLKNNKLVITHGNGPQVGFILRRAELARGELHMIPLDSCVADTQGAIGYNIQMALQNELKKEGLSISVVSLITQVVVDADDISFQNPTKPIGSFMNEVEARRHREGDGWTVMEDSGRGFRRVVASPVPQEIIELDAVKTLLDHGHVVIAAGGGGIPVVRTDSGGIRGAEAVIDKDLVSALLARGLGADLLVISTAVEKVYLNFGTVNAKPLDLLDLKKAEIYIKQGQFGVGSMLPKIKAMIDFIRATGKEGIITNSENLGAALEGRAGTRLIP